MVEAHWPRGKEVANGAKIGLVQDRVEADTLLK